LSASATLWWREPPRQTLAPRRPRWPACGGSGLSWPRCCGSLFRRFDNRRQIAAYAGLTPSPWQSGGIDREQGIAKSGNPRLRRAMIELAWFWVRHQPGSALSRWFVERVGTARGRVRRIAIVALARKLLVALWRYVTQGVVPQGAVLKA
jgi:transposase